MTKHFPGDHFQRIDHKLHLGGADLSELARRFGTPLFVYDFGRVRSLASQITKELRGVSHGSRAFFAVKALGNLSALQVIHQQGLGMDVVSGGEIQRCLAAGIPASDIIFSGVAKSRSEIEMGIQAGIACFNIESPHEIDLLAEIAGNRRQKVKIALRVNPDVDGKTHKKINTGPADTKFGLSPELAKSICKRVLETKYLSLEGLSCHIGSQILDLSSFSNAANEMRDFARELMILGARFHHIDMGGGVGVAYRPSEWEQVPTFSQWVNISKKALPSNDVDLYLEPGRSIVGDSAVLLTQVLDIKTGATKKFALTDAGMTELIRPAMYDAYHHIEPLWFKDSDSGDQYDVVGPVCETSCSLGYDMRLGPLKIGDILAVFTAGAYGMSMASNYNSRTRPPEVAIDRGSIRQIKKREELPALWTDEIGFLER